MVTYRTIGGLHDSILTCTYLSQMGWNYYLDEHTTAEKARWNYASWICVWIEKDMHAQPFCGLSNPDCGHTVDGSEIRLTSWYGKYLPLFTGVLYIPGGAGFLLSTEGLKWWKYTAPAEKRWMEDPLKGNIYLVYKWYILPIGWLYYMLPTTFLQEPKKYVDHTLSFPFKAR